MSDEKLNANMYIDGNFAFHIHSYLVKNYKKVIAWEQLLQYVKEKIKTQNPSVKNCKLETKCFLGTDYITKDKSRDYLTNSMTCTGKIMNYPTLLKKKDNGGLKEDAVDTNLVFHATKDYYESDTSSYEYLVLLAGDSDFVPLVNNLKEEGVKFFLLYIDFEDSLLGRTRTAQNLLEISDIRVNIQHLIDERVDDKIKSIFQDCPSELVSPHVVHEKDSSRITESPDDFWSDFVTALKGVQENKCGGRNDYVLINQVGERLSASSGKNRHGNLLKTLMQSYSVKIEIEDSNPNAKKVRLKVGE